MHGFQIVREHVGMLLLLVATGMPCAAPARAGTAYEDCLLRALRNASPSATVGELRAQCSADVAPAPGLSPEEDTAAQERLELEAALADNPWVITAHRPNYLLPITYNDDVNTAPFEAAGEPERLKNEEVHFQFSFKFPLARRLLDGHTDLYFAYTNRSFWQAYTSENSSPFRETNHEPELFLQRENEWRIFGWTNSLLAAGYNHQSNGRAGALSRSWDRLFASAWFERGKWALNIRPWIMFPQGEGDDNPDIDDYMGYGELRVFYHHAGRVLTLMERNGLTSDGKGAFQLSYSFPLHGRLKGYVQYFNGYGESLLDYNARVERLGIGFAISDWY